MAASSANKEDGAVAARRRWMAVLARMPESSLEDAFRRLSSAPAYVSLRKPEIGSVLVRARIGGQGRRFNLGEMTMTRCSVRTDEGLVGHAYVAGRKPRVAELAALFDALMQNPVLAGALEQSLIGPNARAQDEARRRRAAQAAASKVSFFTMVRGEDQP